MKKKVEKGIYSTQDMLDYGYQRRLLHEIAHDPDCTHLFFRTGTGKTSNIYYYKEKVERWLEMREDERMVEKR